MLCEWIRGDTALQKQAKERSVSMGGKWRDRYQMRYPVHRQLASPVQSVGNLEAAATEL